MDLSHKPCPACGAPSAIEEPRCAACGGEFSAIHASAVSARPAWERPIDASRRRIANTTSALALLVVAVGAALLVFSAVREPRGPRIPGQSTAAGARVLDSQATAIHQVPLPAAGSRIMSVQAPVQPQVANPPTGSPLVDAQAMPAAPPAGPFVEMSGRTEMPVIHITCSQDDTVTFRLYVEDRIAYELTIPPWQTRSVQVMPGQYDFEAFNTDESIGPGYGDATFRRFKDYRADFVLGKAGDGGPQHLGD